MARARGSPPPKATPANWLGPLPKPPPEPGARVKRELGAGVESVAPKRPATAQAQRGPAQPMAAGAAAAVSSDAPASAGGVVGPVTESVP
eukprot:12315211-Alexandrium_andersonii.AAC.1